MQPPGHKPKIFFVFPYRGIGGVPVLFVRMGEYLASQGKADVYFIDYPDGAMATMMKPGVAMLVNYSDDGRVVIPNGSFAVFQSMSPWSLFPGLAVGNEVRLLFWNCHPFNLVPTLPGLRQLMQTRRNVARFLLKTLLLRWRSRMRAFLGYLLRENALVFMDVNNFSATQSYLDYQIDQPKYLAISIVTTGFELADSVGRWQDPNGPIRIAWLGRVVDFKFYILKRTLLQLDQIQCRLTKRIEVTVVGDGELSDKLRQVATSLKNISVLFIDKINISELDDYLRNHTDLLFGMGTSALEGARLGIPTILLDMSYKEVPVNYKYQWLYARQGYTLGDIISNQHLADDDGSLSQRLEDLLTDFISCARNSREYVLRNHGLELNSSKFLMYLEGSSATWGELRNSGLLKKGWIYSVFSALKNLSRRKRYSGL